MFVMFARCLSRTLLIGMLSTLKIFILLDAPSQIMVFSLLWAEIGHTLGISTIFVVTNPISLPEVVPKSSNH